MILDKLVCWDKDCNMEFHPENYNVISITANKSEDTTIQYTFNGCTLDITYTAKYLGVNIVSN